MEAGTAPTDQQREVALLASSVLLAAQRIATERRNEGKENQESTVKDYLRSLGFTEVRTVAIKHDREGTATHAILRRVPARRAQGRCCGETARHAPHGNRVQGVKQLHQQREALEQRRRRESRILDQAVRHRAGRAIRSAGRRLQGAEPGTSAGARALSVLVA